MDPHESLDIESLQQRSQRHGQQMSTASRIHGHIMILRLQALDLTHGDRHDPAALACEQALEWLPRLRQRSRDLHDP